MSAARGQGSVYRRGRTWWISYYVGGKRKRESSKSERQSEAVDLLNTRLRERGRRVSRRDLEKVAFEDLAELILADYRKNGRRSIRRIETALLHLRPAFADWRAVDIREDAIDRYAADRLAERAARASVNRELAALRRMFKLAERAGMARDIPTFELLTEDNVRTGFVEAPAFVTIRDALPLHIRPIAEVGYLTGWRKSELLSRRWSHVDLEGGWLRLEPGETKNGRGRMFPLIPQLRAVLERQWERKREIERQTGRIVTALFFHDDGRPVKTFRRAWAAASVASGHWRPRTDREGDPVLDSSGDVEKLPALLFHDLRRTAARNLVRAGVPAIQAKDFTGHETLSVFDRYAIADEVSMREAGEKYAAQLGGLDAKPERKVVDLK